MREYFKIWASAAAILALMQSLSMAQDQKLGWHLGRSRVNVKMANLGILGAAEKEPAFRYDTVSDDMESDLLLLNGVDDSLAPIPEESCPSAESCCVKCYEFWEHRDALWGEFLYLRPRGADVIFATPVDGPITNQRLVGAQAVADFEYDSGFRVGGSWAIDQCSSFTGNYTWYQADSNDGVILPGGGSYLRTDTVHSSTVNVAGDPLSARAHYGFDMQAIDLNYKALLWGGDCHAVNYLFGLKYARVEQELGVAYSELTNTNVDTNVDFNGVGPRFGFEAERSLGDCGVLLYTKGTVNFLFGSSSSNYLQTNDFTIVQVQSSLRETRVVTVPEFEMGAGWQSCNGCFRITAGYYLASWFNMMTTPEYLSTVREIPNSFERQVKTLTLDGMSIRAEFRF